jgi:sortase (surface protein transpeptidase)
VTAHRGNRAATTVLVASLATLALTSLTWEQREGAPAVAAATAPEAAPATSAPPLPGRPEESPAAEPADAAVPVRVRVASVDLRMPVAPKGVAKDGQMALPPRPSTLGWYRFGPAPGEAGSTVLAGHVDTRRHGIGPLARLREVEAGAAVTVLLSDGRLMRYRTVSVRSVDKQSRALASVFDRDGRSTLRIVTCGGEFDRDAREYEENVILTAVPLRR